MFELLKELRVAVVEPMELRIDNQAAIGQLERETTSALDKHVNVPLKFSRHHYTARTVQPVYVKTAWNLADMLTKAVSAPKDAEHWGLLGVH
ncbi:hypothetical protein PybrP1_011546 [[Pythium] brassicae (nom. inval.)]|nr:hypothetical protein PybrP1_011546 [[Pythium] brassicae (nom. inval.)]